MQKDTCKKTIEFSLIVLINQNKVRLETPLDTNWKELGTNERKQLLEYVKERGNNYTECRDYSYLIKGEESDERELTLSARKDNSGKIEILLSQQ